MQLDKDKLLNDSIDLDTLLVVFFNRIDALLRIFLISFVVLFLFYLLDQRIYQSSTLINFEQNSNSLANSLASTSNPSSTGLKGEMEIYKSVSTVSGAIDKLIDDGVLEEVPTISEISSGLSFSNNANLLTVNFRYSKKDDTQIILNYLNQEFLKDAVESNQLTAKKGIEFVESEIPKINLLLADAEENLTEFRTSSGKYLIFGNLSRSENFDSLEKRIKEIEFKELELKEFYKPTHPIYLTLLEQKNLLNEELNALKTGINDIPTEQRTLFNLEQKVNIYSSSLETLEKQKLNLNLTAASSLSNIRIVNDASKASKVSPRISIVLLSIVFLLIGYLYFLINHAVTDKILSIDSLLDFLENRNLFIGAFPLIADEKDDTFKLLNEIEKNDLDRSVISLLGAKDKVNVITSMVGGVGKTYFSIKMFNKLNQLGKRVCLIDFDLRKEGISSSIGEENAKILNMKDLDLDDNQIDSCIIKVPDNRDPLKFFNSEELDIFLEKIRENFDLVLIDTPPMGTFIDSKLLSQKSNSIIVVLSSHLSTFGEIFSIQKELDSLNKPDIEVKFFLNKVRYFLEIFNYKFRYPLYGDYGYYDYKFLKKEKNQNFIWKFINFYFIKYKKLFFKLLNRR